MLINFSTMNTKILLLLGTLYSCTSLLESAIAQSLQVPKVQTYVSRSLPPDQFRPIIAPFYEAVARHDWRIVSTYMFRTAGTHPQKFVYSAGLASVPNGAVWQMTRMITVECDLPKVQLFGPRGCLVFGVFDSTVQSPSPPRTGAGLGTDPKSQHAQTTVQPLPTARTPRVDLWIERGNQWMVIPDGEIPDESLAIVNLPDLSGGARVYDSLDDVREMDRKHRELRERREKALADTIADIQKTYSTIKNPNQLEEADRIAKAKMKALGDEVNRLNAERNKQEEIEQAKQVDRALQNRK